LIAPVHKFRHFGQLTHGALTKFKASWLRKQIQWLSLLGTKYPKVSPVERKNRIDFILIGKMHQGDIGQLEVLVGVAIQYCGHRSGVYFGLNFNSQETGRR